MTQRGCADAVTGEETTGRLATGSGGGADRGVEKGSKSEVITDSGARMQARRMVLRSSRTLHGQSYAHNAAAVSSAIYQAPI